MRRLLLMLVPVSGCFCNPLNEQLAPLGGSIALGAGLDIAVAPGCRDSDLRLVPVGDGRGKIGLFWVDPPTCASSSVKSVESLTWSNKNVFTVLDGGLAPGGVFYMNTRADLAGDTTLTVTVTSSKGTRLVAEGDYHVLAVDRVKVRPYCTGWYTKSSLEPADLSLLPTGSMLETELAMFNGTTQLGGYGLQALELGPISLAADKGDVVTLQMPLNPQAVHITSSFDPAFSFDVRVIDAASFDELALELPSAPYLYVDEGRRLSASPKLLGRYACVDTFTATWVSETPSTCEVNAAQFGLPMGREVYGQGKAPGMCRLRVTLDGTTLSRTVDLEVRPAVVFEPATLPALSRSHLEAIWASDDAGVFVVGSEDPGSRLVLQGPPFARVDAMAPVTMGDGGRFTALKAVWASGPSDVWAAGHGVVHFDGGGWTEIETSGVFGTVWGSGPGDVWYGGTDLAHNGSRFGSAIEILEISGTGPSDVWLRVSNAIVQLDGGVETRDGGFTSLDLWNRVHRTSLPPGPGTSPLWGTGPNDVWQVNGIGAFHWDGVYWEQFYFGGAIELRGVYGTATDVWVVGEKRVWRYRR